MALFNYNIVRTDNFNQETNNNKKQSANLWEAKLFSPRKVFMFEKYSVKQYPSVGFFKHIFLCVWQSPVQLDDFDAYIRDMAKDSDYKFSLQFEVSGKSRPCLLVDGARELAGVGWCPVFAHWAALGMRLHHKQNGLRSMYLICRFRDRMSAFSY